MGERRLEPVRRVPELVERRRDEVDTTLALALGGSLPSGARRARRDPTPRRPFRTRMSRSARARRRSGRFSPARGARSVPAPTGRVLSSPNRPREYMKLRIVPTKTHGAIDMATGPGADRLADAAPHERQHRRDDPAARRRRARDGERAADRLRVRAQAGRAHARPPRARRARRCRARRHAVPDRRLEEGAPALAAARDHRRERGVPRADDEGAPAARSPVAAYAPKAAIAAAAAGALATTVLVGRRVVATD